MTEARGARRTEAALDLDGTTLVLEQPARGTGFRVNVDALHLARFAAPRARGVLVDLGAGTGVVGLATTLLAPTRPRKLILVESDEASAALARGNVERSGTSAEVLVRDVAAAGRSLRGVADTIVCNPPYFEPGRARPPSVAPGARIGALAPFVDATRTMLGRRGRAYFVYPAADLARVLTLFGGRGLVAKRARFVHATDGAAARLVMVEFVAGKPGGLVVEAPLMG